MNDSQQHLHQIADVVRQSGLAAAALDAYGTIILCNAKMATMLGFGNEEDPVGQSFHKWVDPEGGADFRLALDHRVPSVIHHGVLTALAASELPHVAVLPMVGAVLVQVWHGSGSTGTSVHFPEFVAGIAHEINNPLQFALPGIEEAAAVIRQGPERAGEAESLLEQVRIGLERIRGVVHDLRSFRVTEAPDAVVDVNEVSAETVNLVRRKFPTVRIAWDFGQGVLARGNAGQLGQVLLNLLSNACKVMESRGDHNNLVTVRTWAFGDAVHISVVDNGPGMSASLQKNVFDPFVSQRAGGTGLGLTVCRNLVQSMGGTIDVHSVEGVGTTFEVRLCRGGIPRVQDQANVQVDASSEIRTVLVVDDEDLVRRSMCRALRPHVDDVLQFGGGFDAVEWLKQGNPVDAILCDRMMPNGDGLFVLEWLREHRPDIVDRLIFVTGATRSVAHHANPILLKPFSLDELKEMVFRVAI